MGFAVLQLLLNQLPSTLAAIGFEATTDKYHSINQDIRAETGLTFSLIILPFVACVWHEAAIYLTRDKPAGELGVHELDDVCQSANGDALM